MKKINVMNRIILLLVAPFIFFTAQANTVTQEEANNIVLERLSQETRPYIVYTKDGAQQKMTVTSVNGEVLEVNYKFWVYYINYINSGSYIFVKESNGNLLEVNVSSNATPKDLKDWKEIYNSLSNCNRSVIISADEYEKAPDNQVFIEDMKIVDDCLTITYTASICDSRIWNLVDREGVIKTLPCQRELRFSVAWRADYECAAAMPVTREMSFNIKDLQIQRYNSVLLNISGKSILYEYGLEKTEDYVEGYIVGTFIGSSSSGSDSFTPRGYCIKLIGNDSSPMSFYTFSLTDSSEVITHGISNKDDCGPIFFLNDDYRKIKFKYKIVENKLDFVTGPCMAMYPMFPWNIYDEVEIYDVLQETVPFSDAAMTTSVNNFSMNFFATAYEELSADENIVFSPLSLNMALAMVWNGANGETRQGIQQAMGMQNYSQEEVNSYFLNLRNDLTTVDLDVKLALANSIWYDNGFPVKTDFVTVNKNYYDAEVKEINFRAPDAPDQINQWCSDNTNGLIKDMIDGIPGDVVMYLINALYFKGLWADSCGFDPERTRQAYFNKETGENVSVNMMTQKRNDIDYYRDDHLEIVTLPYGNGAYSMIFALPKNGFGEMLLQLKQSGYWQNCLSNLKQQEVELFIPKFKVEYEPKPNLNNILTKLGMGIAFTGFADFSGISDVSLAISEVRQKTYIEVDEKGTEAAAVTLVGMFVTSVPSHPVFRADRPFLFVIQENTTGTALFMGKIGNPN